MQTPQGSIDARSSAATHRRRRWPIPLALLVAVAAVVAAVPTIRRGNELARRERCAQNMKRIGQAMLLYSNDFRGRYPDTFATLARHRPSGGGPPIDLARFVCPSSDDAVPDAAEADRGSYRLTADSMPSAIELYGPRPDGSVRLLSSLRGGELAAIEVPGHHADGVHVLYSDGMVDFLPLSHVRAATWADTHDDVIHDRPIRWPASQPWR